MAKRAGGESLAVLVYTQLRSAILDCELAPGERLKPAELSARFEVSLSVIREALGLLAAKDLVQVDRNRGFRVTPLSLQALTDLTEARVVNEGSALRLSVQRGGVSWESEVLAAHHRLASTPMLSTTSPPRHNEQWAQAHLEFHHTLIQACGNTVLLDICTRLSDAAELYRAWSGPAMVEQHRDVGREHRGLVEAALAHDADLAVARFEAHVNLTRQLLMEFSLNTADPTDTASERAS